MSLVQIQAGSCRPAVRWVSGFILHFWVQVFAPWTSLAELAEQLVLEARWSSLFYISKMNHTSAEVTFMFEGETLVMGIPSALHIYFIPLSTVLSLDKAQHGAESWGIFFQRETGNPLSATGMGYRLLWYCQHGQGFDIYATDSISRTSCRDYSPAKLEWGINSIKAEDTTQPANLTSRWFGLWLPTEGQTRAVHWNYCLWHLHTQSLCLAVSTQLPTPLFPLLVAAVV